MTTTLPGLPQEYLLPESGQAQNVFPSVPEIQALSDWLLESGPFAGFNTAMDDDLAQGVLQALFELQRTVADATAMAGVSLAAGELPDALQAVIAMLSRHAGDRDTKRLLVLGDVTPGIPAVAREFAMAVEPVTKLESVTPDPACADLLVLSLAELMAGTVDSAELQAWREKGGIVLVDGYRQHLLPADQAPGALPVDILLLDLELMFDVTGAPLALVANENLQRYLPTPVVARDERVYVRQGPAQRPHSVGALHAGMPALSGLMRCFTSLRLLGMSELRLRAIRRVVINRFLLHSLGSAAAVAGNTDSLAMRHLVWRIESAGIRSQPVLADFVVDDNGSTACLSFAAMTHLQGAELERIGGLLGDLGAECQWG